MKKTSFLKLFTAFIAIMLMSIAMNATFGVGILACSVVLLAASLLFSFLPETNVCLQTLVPSVFEIDTYGYKRKRLPSRTNRFNNRAGTCYESDAEKTEREKKEKESKEIEIKTSADLLKHLNETKSALEAAVKTEVKAEVKEATEEKLAEIQKKIDEVKGLPETVTAEDLIKIKEDSAIMQKAIDRFSINFKNMNSKAPKMEKKSFGEALSEAIEKNTDQLNKFNRKEVKKFDIEIDMKAVGAISTSSITGSTVYGAQRRQDIIMNPNTMTHVRDLLPVSPAGPGTDYYFMRENGDGEGAPTAVAEATAAATPTTAATGLKPQFDMDLVESSVKFEYIAGWLLTSRKAMMNIPGFTSFLQRRVPQKLMDAEDAQLLYGDGATPNIKGLLTAGNYVAGQSAGATPLIEKIIKDISTFEDTYKRLATGIALRPADYFGFFLNKATGSGEYDLPPGVIFVNGILYILGVPVAKTTALNQYDYVVGDFQNGAELLVQEAMRLEFFEQDSTNVRTNQITVRVEESVAFPVFGSNYFMKGSSNPSAS